MQTDLTGAELPNELDCQEFIDAYNAENFMEVAEIDEEYYPFLEDVFNLAKRLEEFYDD